MERDADRHGPMKRLAVDVPVDLRNRLDAYATGKRWTLRIAVTELLESALAAEAGEGRQAG